MTQLLIRNWSITLSILLGLALLSWHGYWTLQGNGMISVEQSFSIIANVAGLVTSLQALYLVIRHHQNGLGVLSGFLSIPTFTGCFGLFIYCFNQIAPILTRLPLL